MEEVQEIEMEIIMPGFITKTVDNKQVVFYNITIKIKGNSWKIEKRFNEFVNLHKELAQWIQNPPAFPSKNVLTKKDDQFNINRKCKLEMYLRNLLTRDGIFTIQTFIRFLEMDTQAMHLIPNQMDIKGRIDQKLGYRDILHMPQYKLYFAASADTNVTSRLDSYLNNAKFLWSKKAKENQEVMKKVVGAVSCWQKTKETTLMHENYEIMWQVEFKSQAICMRVCEDQEIVAVGTDDGFLRIFMVDFEQPKNVVVKHEKQVHKGRLMDMWIDSRRKIIFTIGEDKFLRTFSVVNGGIINGNLKNMKNY